MTTNKTTLALGGIVAAALAAGTAHADCGGNASLEVSNSFRTQPGVVVTAEQQPFVQATGRVKCGNFIGYSTVLAEGDGDVNRYVIGGMGVLPIEGTGVTLRASLDNLHLPGPEIDIPRARIGAVAKLPYGLTGEVDRFEFLDGSDRGFTEWNVNGGYSINEDLKLTGRVGGAFSDGFMTSSGELSDRLYGQLGAQYTTDSGITVYGTADHQVEPMEDTRYLVGVRGSF